MSKLFWPVIAIIGVLALCIRIMGFVDIPDLYGDEVSLAFNLFGRDFSGYFEKLDIAQAAPPFYLILTRIFTYFVSDFEYSLRIVPFFASVLSVFAFLFLLLKVFKNKTAIITAFSLFCFMPKLLRYAVAFKQYSLDVLIFILILLSYFYLDFNKKDWKFYSLIIIYGVLIWFSYPAMFAFAAVFSVKLIENLYETKNFKTPLKNLMYSIPFVLSFVVFYISQRQLNSNPVLHKYWESGFLNYDFSNILNIFTFNFKYFFPDFALLALVFFVLGLVFIFKNIKKDGALNGFNLVLCMCLFIALLLSYLHIYPFSMRVTLYFVPVFAIIISSFFEYFNFQQSTLRKVFVYFFAFLFSALSIGNAVYSTVFKTYYTERVETVMRQARQLMDKDSDVLYISGGSRASAKFYIDKRPEIYDFKNIYYEELPDEIALSPEKYVEFLKNHIENNFKKGTTFYYIFTHHPNKPGMLNKLYLFSKDRKNFRIYTNNHTFDALIIFSN